MKEFVMKITGKNEKMVSEVVRNAVAPPAVSGEVRKRDGRVGSAEGQREDYKVEKRGEVQDVIEANQAGIIENAGPEDKNSAPVDEERANLIALSTRLKIEQAEPFDLSAEKILTYLR